MKIFGLKIKWPKRLNGSNSNSEQGQSKSRFNLLGQNYADPLGGLPVRGGKQNEVFGTVRPTDTESGFGLTQRPLTNAEYNNLYELARSNHDISYAVSNIVELANTPIKIEFDSSVSDSQSEQMLMAIRRAEKDWFEGGRPMLMNALYRQLAITGALSAEAKPNANLEGVGRVTLLSPKWVYFGYQDSTSSFVPYQQVSGFGGFYEGTNSTFGQAYQPLSLKTYQYIAIARDEDNPYAIPPILSAVESTCLESEMLENLNAVVKRLGMFGFTKFSVTAPKRGLDADGMPESDAAYADRVADHLAQVEAEVERGMSNGYVVAAKQIKKDGTETHSLEAEMNASTSDASGAAAVIELVQQIKAAGLKQDPVFLGKNFSTSEALAKVLLKKFSGQLADYQEAVAQFLEHAYGLHLQLLGFNFQRIDVSFEPPILEDTKTQYESNILKKDYYKDLRNQGIITQQEFANAMGYDAPANDGPMVDASTIEQPEQEEVAANKMEEKPKEKGLSQFELMQLNKTSDDRYITELRRYNKATMSNLKAAAKAIVQDLVYMLNNYEGSDSYKRTAAKLAILGGWQRHFEKPQIEASGKWCENAYKVFRKDKSVFGGKPSSPAKMEVEDYMFADDFRDTDILAMAKVMQQQVDNLPLDVALGIPKGRLKASDLLPVKLAIERLSEQLINISTSTAANIRVVAGLMYLRQEDVETYLIGNSSALACSSCEEKEGSVQEAYSRLQNFVVSKTRNALMPPVPMLTGSNWDASTAVFESCKCKIRAKW